MDDILTRRGFFKNKMKVTSILLKLLTMILLK